MLVFACYVKSMEKQNSTHEIYQVHTLLLTEEGSKAGIC
jgi:hypothetical protein